MIIFSGGAVGTDLVFEKYAELFQIPIIAYTFDNHKTKTQHSFMLSNEKLKEAMEFVITANNRLQREFPSKNVYINKLLERDYYIIRYATIVIAFGYFDQVTNEVDGGTAWGIEMAKDKRIPIYLFNLDEYKWYGWNYNEPTRFFETARPMVTKNEKIAGIGTRKVKFHLTRIESEIKTILDIKK